ncbi:conserved hypothetical protein [Shewanella sediminis HAW-EB3]|uniref:Uncharacterized protein n=2 Tax=Shewanella sediminis TaxID=271097 RepID=A8FVE6_SHESH|nr:conserved hypothetical protein [Shewanella sediminis HAW-EB3]
MLGLFCSSCSHDAPKDVSKTTKDSSLCDFNAGKCTQSVAGVGFDLLITPYNSPSERPLTLELISSEPVNNLAMRVEGRDMFMGVIPVNLTKVDENLYNGQLIYGSCSSNYMVWRAFVTFNKEGSQHIVMFDFLADNEESEL